MHLLSQVGFPDDLVLLDFNSKHMQSTKARAFFLGFYLVLEGDLVEARRTSQGSFCSSTVPLGPLLILFIFERVEQGL